MPNFIKVDSKPFHPDSYVGPEHDDEDSHHPESVREKSMTIKLKVENTVRWRWAKDEFGQDVSVIHHISQLSNVSSGTVLTSAFCCFFVHARSPFLTTFTVPRPFASPLSSRRAKPSRFILYANTHTSSRGGNLIAEL